jgi:hypothetical protein
MLKTVNTSPRPVMLGFLEMRRLGEKGHLLLKNSWQNPGERAVSARESPLSVEIRIIDQFLLGN